MPKLSRRWIIYIVFTVLAAVIMVVTMSLSKPAALAVLVTGLPH